jgi:D-3-phosphoglycerate dehydrogenase
LTVSFRVVSTCNVPFVIGPLLFQGVTNAEFLHRACDTEDEVIVLTQNSDAVVIGHEPYTRRVVERLGSCRLMCTPKAGYDNIDVAAATERGICVSNVAGVSSEEASDHAMALLLSCARKLFQEDRAVRAGLWRSIHGPEMEAVWRGIAPLRGRTLGLIGLGQAGRALVPKAKGFGMRVLVYDPYVPDDVVRELEVERSDLDRLLKESDFVSVHSALTARNRHMLGREQFRLMKPGAYFINTARGGLVDEKALLEALTEKRIAGAGLDVLEVEPARMDNPLLKLENVIVTGHSAHYSDKAIATIRRRPEEDVARIRSGGWPIGWVNPEVKEYYLARWGTPR